MTKWAEPKFVEDKEGITYQMRVPFGLRVLALFFALVALAVPFPFLAYTPWSEPGWAREIGTLGVFLPPIVAGLFAMMGLMPNQRLRFDATRQMVVDDRAGPLGRRRREFAFAEITGASITMREPEAGPPFPVLMLGVTGRRPMELGTFDELTNAEFWRERILALVGAR